MTAVALLSGGLDSLVAATHAARHGGLALALTVDYGQRAFIRERDAARAVAEILGADHNVVDLTFLGGLGASALTRRDRDLPVTDSTDLDRREAAEDRARSVWVPNRNGIFIQVAAAFAQDRGLGRVIVGFNREEAVTFPDNRIEFLEASTSALAFTLNRPVSVESPTALLDKPGIVKLGLRLGAPLRRIWSCYDGGERHCGRCESCLRLRRALEAGGVPGALRTELGLS